MSDTTTTSGASEHHDAAELRELFRVLRDGVLLCDADLRILRANDAFLKLTHRTLRDVVGQVADDVFYRLSVFGSRSQFWKRLRETGRYELQFRAPSGRRSFHLTGSRLNCQGRQGYALVLRETTTADAISERFLQTEKLGALANVLSKMANQLNNPLQSVIGFADVLASRTDDPHWLEDVRVIQNESRRTAHMLKSLLLYSRRLRPEPARLDLNPFVEATAKEWHHHAPAPRVELELFLAPESPVVLADAFQIEQVLRHLLHHAHQAVAVGPSGLHVLCVVVEGEAQRAQITVGHNGPALPRHRLRRIFEPDFHQPPESPETGLELTVCRDVVRAHGGEIQCLSEPGLGTRFMFELPLTQRPETTFLERPDAELVETRRVMVIDDEPSVGALLKEILTVKNYEPECFTSARAALECLGETQFDMILCDINMPEMNGKEFYRQLAQQQPELATKVVFATGDLISDHADFFHDGHGHEVLAKPFKVDELLQVIQRRLRHTAGAN